MPGIYGIVGDINNFESMHKTMIYDSIYNAKYLKVNNNTNLGTSFYKNESYDLFENEEYVVGFDGYFYTSDSKVSNDVNQIFSLYIQFKDDFVRHLDGVFNIFIYNKLENKLTIFNDWAGNHLLFYFWDGTNFIFSTEIKSILKIIKTKTINKKGVMQQFLFNHLLFDETLINEIKALDAASILRVGGRKLEIEQYYDIKNDIVINNESNINSSVEKLYAKFDYATKKFMSIEKISLPMTGGIDSRLLLHFMLKYNYKFADIFTMGTEKDEDVKIAKLICNHYGLKHRTYERTYENLRDCLEESYGHHDGILGSIFSHIEKQKEILNNNCYSMIQYFYNDIIFGEKFAFKNRFLRQKNYNSESIEKIINFFSTSDISKINSLFKENETSQSIFDEVRKFLNVGEHLPLFSVFDYFSWYQHCRRFLNIGSSLSRSARYVRRYVPSQDKEIIKFAFCLPYKYRQWRFLLRKTIEKKCLDMAEFPREGTGLSLKRNNSMQIIGKAYRKYIKRDLYTQDLQKMYIYFYNEIVINKIDRLLFSADNRTDEILDPKAKKTIWIQNKNGINNTSIIHNMINLEIFLRKYF